MKKEKLWEMKMAGGKKKVDVDYVVATPVYELKYYINSYPINILKE